MKTITKILMISAAMLMVLHLQAQNYKTPKIDATGKIINAKGSVIGSVTLDGTISDAAGTKVAYVDGQGNMVDAKTGEVLGKPAKNGIFLPHFTKTSDKGWSVSTPMNGTCTVKGGNGKIKVLVHDNYKKFGACAFHCLQRNTDHH